MPTALCVVGKADDPDQILTLDFEGGQDYVLPAVDIAGYTTDEHIASVGGYLQYRLRKRFGIVAAKGSLKTPAMAHYHNYRVEDMKSPQFPDTHFRTYFPASGLFTRLRPAASLGRITRVIRPIEEVKEAFTDEVAAGYGHIAMVKMAIEALDLYDNTIITARS